MREYLNEPAEPLNEKIYELHLLKNRKQILETFLESIKSKENFFIEKNISMDIIAHESNIEQILKETIPNEYNELTQYNVCIFCNEFFTKEIITISDKIVSERTRYY